MKVTIAISGLLFLFACTTSGEKGNDAHSDTDLKQYGPYEVKKDEAVSVEEMLKDFTSKTGEQEYTFVGEIEEVCSKMGCWLSVDQGNGESFMVRFKDHFTIPTDTRLGSVAYMHGVAHWDTISVEDQRHYLEDAGKSEEEMNKITEAKYELGFEADGILVEPIKEKKHNKESK